MPNIEPLISIIVPVYNSEKYLSRCIESILAQSFKNLEILLVERRNFGYTIISDKIMIKLR